jgi:hypothetical protein
MFCLSPFLRCWCSQDEQVVQCRFLSSERLVWRHVGDCTVTCLIVQPICMDDCILPEFGTESRGAQKTSFLLFQRSVVSFCCPILTGFVLAGSLHNVAVLICCLSEFVSDKFSAVVGSDCWRNMASNMFKILCFRSHMFAEIGWIELADRQVCGAFGFVAPDSVFWRKLSIKVAGGLSLFKGNVQICCVVAASTMSKQHDSPRQPSVACLPLAAPFATTSGNSSGPRMNPRSMWCAVAIFRSNRWS